MYDNLFPLDPNLINHQSVASPRSYGCELLGLRCIHCGGAFCLSQVGWGVCVRGKVLYTKNTAGFHRVFCLPIVWLVSLYCHILEGFCREIENLPPEIMWKYETNRWILFDEVSKLFNIKRRYNDWRWLHLWIFIVLNLHGLAAQADGSKFWDADRSGGTHWKQTGEQYPRYPKTWTVATLKTIWSGVGNVILEKTHVIQGRLDMSWCRIVAVNLKKLLSQVVLC